MCKWSGSQGAGKITPKEKVALGSVIAAVLLVVTKITVGVWTNSLGILSEALHSSIDLIAAAVTLMAVRMADRPPDLDHQYGHEKVESLSSLAETALLFFTCAWIVYEAVNRLFFHNAVVEVTYVAVLVMVFSIGVDYTRSRALMKMAKKYRSQALEADAVHFSTDMLSSVVVLIGVFLTMWGFKSFDSIAALFVAGITAWIGWRLWKKSVHTLMDGAPAGIRDMVAQEAGQVKDVLRVGQVRVRESGHRTFVDCTVYINKVLPLEQAHAVTENVIKRVEDKIPDCDIVVYAEPLMAENSDLMERIRAAAADFYEVKNVHNLLINEYENGLHIDFHVELDAALSVAQAHSIVTDLENRVLTLDKRISYITSHIEPATGPTCCIQDADEEMNELVISVRQIVKEFPKVKGCERVMIRRMEGKLKLSMCCLFDGDLNVVEAHDVATQLENMIRARHEDVYKISIHMEPEGDAE